MGSVRVEVLVAADEGLDTRTLDNDSAGAGNGLVEMAFNNGSGVSGIDLETGAARTGDKVAGNVSGFGGRGPVTDKQDIIQ